MKHFLAAAGLVSLLLITGCTSPMALQKDQGSLTLNGDAIALFSLRTTKKDVEPHYPAKVQQCKVVALDDSAKKTFRVGDPCAIEGHNYNYLVSMRLTPGKWRVEDIFGGCYGVLICGTFDFPLNAEFSVKPDEIVYIGHFDMINRKRNAGERRAGSIIPLIDQKVSGFGYSTFDVYVHNQYKKDMELFRKNYPVLRGMEVRDSCASVPGAKLSAVAP